MIFDLFLYNDKESLEYIYNKNISSIKISNIDFFKEKNVIFIKDDIRDYPDVELINIEKYGLYYDKGIVTQIVYRKNKTNKILLTYNKKWDYPLYTIYKASLEFHFFLQKCVRSKNDIFIQISFTGIDRENIKLFFNTNKKLIKNIENLDFDTIYNIIREQIIEKYNFYFKIKSIELYVYFLYNENIKVDIDQRNEINQCMNTFYSLKKYLLSRKKELREKDKYHPKKK